MSVECSINVCALLILPGWYNKENITAFVSIAAQTICSYYDISMILHFIITTDITMLPTDQKSEDQKYT